MERKFWRLLGDYERLTRDETLAIKEEAFEIVVELSRTKSVIFDELVRIADTLGIDRRHTPFNARLKLLAQAEQRNVAILQDCVSRARCIQQTLSATCKRLHTFERVYTWDAGAQKSESRFTAEG